MLCRSHLQHVFRPVPPESRLKERIVLDGPELEVDVAADLINARPVKRDLAVGTEGVRRERVAGEPKEQPVCASSIIPGEAGVIPGVVSFTYRSP